MTSPKGPRPTLNALAHTGTSKPIKPNVTAPGNHTQTPLPIRTKVSLRTFTPPLRLKSEISGLKVTKKHEEVTRTRCEEERARLDVEAWERLGVLKEKRDEMFGRLKRRIEAYLANFI
ncbi:MAG: hypothetical protein QXK12_00395 [Candidatus Nezhaarchaeales archaeon]